MSDEGFVRCPYYLSLANAPQHQNTLYQSVFNEKKRLPFVRDSLSNVNLVSFLIIIIRELALRFSEFAFHDVFIISTRAIARVLLSTGSAGGLLTFLLVSSLTDGLHVGL